MRLVGVRTYVPHWPRSITYHYPQVWNTCSFFLPPIEDERHQDEDRNAQDENHPNRNCLEHQSLPEGNNALDPV